MDGAPAGVVVVSDAAREGAQAALAALQKQHLHCAMLTGARPGFEPQAARGGAVCYGAVAEAALALCHAASPSCLGGYPVGCIAVRDIPGTVGKSGV